MTREDGRCRSSLVSSALSQPEATFTHNSCERSHEIQRENRTASCWISGIPMTEPMHGARPSSEMPRNATDKQPCNALKGALRAASAAGVQLGSTCCFPASPHNLCLRVCVQPPTHGIRACVHHRKSWRIDGMQPHAGEKKDGLKYQPPGEQIWE